jgi:hypothetical protein
MTSYLIFSDLASAQARSHQQAVAKGCTGDTDYWWAQIVNQSTGQAALIIEDAVRANGSDYTSAGLSDTEKAALVPQAIMDPMWFPVSSP